MMSRLRNLMLGFGLGCGLVAFSAGGYAQQESTPASSPVQQQRVTVDTYRTLEPKDVNGYVINTQRVVIGGLGAAVIAIFFYFLGKKSGSNSKPE